ncbi:unnamed protein product, partial [Ilex paraguariensis]
RGVVTFSRGPLGRPGDTAHDPSRAIGDSRATITFPSPAYYDQFFTFSNLIIFSRALTDHVSLKKEVIWML